MEIVCDIVLIIFLSFVSAGISMLLNYALGLGSDNGIGTSEIFFNYTLGLAKRRLIKEGDTEFLNQALQQTSDSIGFNHSVKTDPLTRVKKDSQMKGAIVERAESFYTWEKAFGMCIYCTGVWIAVLLSLLVTWFFGLSLFQILALLLCLPALSHLILRKI